MLPEGVNAIIMDMAGNKDTCSPMYACGARLPLTGLFLGLNAR